MPEHESILQLKSEVQTLKIKDEYRSKELDGLMIKLSDTSTKLNALSENIGRLLAVQDVNRMTDKEFREEMKILHTRIGDLQDKMNMMVDKTETRMNTDINSIYIKLESLERWRWITIGAATFVAWLLTHVVPKYVN
jgi:predicted nuclease with TOPRIM domain